MKQLIQNYKSGEMTVCETPAPQVSRGGVLVRTAFSLISAGTEKGMVEMARMSLLEKARSRPDLVKKVLDKARTEGFVSAYQKAMLRLSTDTPLGYSSAGTIIAVGEGVQGLRAGMSVACGGIGFASHSEIVYVPKNLCVPVPDGVELSEAAYSTVGAIALQGVRSCSCNIGEVVVVIGLGLVGLLTVQILKASGCLVVGIDLDKRRCQMACDLGADVAGDNWREQMVECLRLSGGFGADAVVITAATSSSEPLEHAGELARDRARIVVVGQVGMEVPRKLYYEKELSLLVSRSYGPGRYDRSYEEKGVDYPIGYVRWTEQRNMSAVLNLIAAKRLDVAALTTHQFPLDRALEAYDMIVNARERFLGVLLTYDQSPAADIHTINLAKSSEARQPSPRPAGSKVGVSVIGAGNFCTGVLLPALSAQDGIALRCICSQRGLSARSAGSRWKFEVCGSDPDAALSDEGTDCVVISTRPDSHARLVCAALEAGKHVFVEKPLAVSREQLDEIYCVALKHPSQILMVGFNRRFAPFVLETKKLLAERKGPIMATYRVNAGQLPAGDWQHDQEQGAGRIIGECGHFVDTLCYLSGSLPSKVFASSISSERSDQCEFENAALTIEFADGSVGVIMYTTHGSSAFSKERLEVFSDGLVAVVDDFRRLEIVSKDLKKKRKDWLSQDKGHAAEIKAFIDGVRSQTAPVPLEDYILTTLCTIKAVESLNSRQPQHVSMSEFPLAPVTVPEELE
jgi:predicted dehydrogenase/threonine dehydrogenase-like Zn-dependent dehydrogenase